MSVSSKNMDFSKKHNHDAIFTLNKIHNNFLMSSSTVHILIFSIVSKVCLFTFGLFKPRSKQDAHTAWGVCLELPLI